MEQGLGQGDPRGHSAQSRGPRKEEEGGPRLEKMGERFQSKGTVLAGIKKGPDAYLQRPWV